jgi:hypothetical protein
MNMTAIIITAIICVSIVMIFKIAAGMNKGDKK